MKTFAFSKDTINKMKRQEALRFVGSLHLTKDLYSEYIKHSADSTRTRPQMFFFKTFPKGDTGMTEKDIKGCLVSVAKEMQRDVHPWP